MHNTPLTILSTTIRQDAKGRYSLGDCWHLSGKAKSNQPSEWYAATKTQNFLSVLGGDRNSPVTPKGETENSLTSAGDPENGITPVAVVTTGPNEGRGYWASREAVIHYATWISPEFYLKVIRAFDELERIKFNVSPPIIDLNDPAFLRQTLLGYTEKVIALEAKNAALAPKAESFDELANQNGRHNLRSAAQQSGWPEKLFIARAVTEGWLYIHSVTGKKLAYADKIKTGLMDVKNVSIQRSSGFSENVGQPLFTQKGLLKFRELIGPYSPPRAVGAA